ncbi:MAG: hypothetical protein GF307_07140 [candidate division Zixibacteria bacterium]|nr:hypothetical protein [candidate division Zixibacteria bacterium]
MISNRFLSALIILLLLIPLNAGAENMNLTIDDAIELGLKNSEKLHSSKMEVKAAKAKAREASILRFPSLSFRGSYYRLSDEKPFEIDAPPPALGTIEISPTIRDNYNFKLTLQQPVFTGLRLHNNYRANKFSADAEEQEFSADKANLIYDIRVSYWSLFKTLKLKNVIDENVELVETHLKDVRNFYEQEIATKNEVLKVEVQLSNAKLKQLDADHAVRLARISLNSAIGLPLDAEISLASDVENGYENFADVNSLTAKAIEERAELKAMGYRVKAGKSAAGVAKAGWFPQIYLVGGYTYARPNSRVMPPTDEFEDSWELGVIATMDIWNWGKSAQQVKYANAQLEKLHDAMAVLEDAVVLEVTRNYLEVEKSGKRIILSEESVAQAEENYRITRDKYRNGVALNSELIDAEVALLEARTNHTHALVDYQLAVAELKKSIGE